MKIYVACLASYNNGVLHGRWIDAVADVDSMQDDVNAILRESKFPNVMVSCPQCDGEGTQTFHNSETGDTREGTCLTCDGKGKVPSAEEFAIHDFDGFPSGLGEYCGLQTIADYVELVEKFDHIDSDAIAAIYDDCRDIDETREALEDNFVGIFNSFRDYADESADEMLACHDIKDDNPVSRYFDYASYARDLKMDMRVIDVPGGVAVFYA